LASNISQSSNAVTVITGSSNDSQAPTAPGNLQTTTITSSSIGLSWTASADNVAVAEYEIYRGGQLVGTSVLPSFIVTGLNQSTSYAFFVKAKDSAGNLSPSSNTVTVSTTNLSTDSQAPTVPTNLQVTAKSATSINLSWTASTDNVGVVGYQLFTGTTLAGTSTGTNFLISGLNPGSVYSISAKAIDGAGNTSASSDAVTVSTDSTGGSQNIATIYYKKGFAVPYIHYRPLGGNWTTSPGNKMDESEVSGYTKVTVDIGTTKGVEAAFNDNNNTWDSNKMTNYVFPPGISTYTPGNAGEPGIIQAGSPNNLSNKATIYYKGAFTTPYIHYRATGTNNNNWTTSPGVAMTAGEVTGYSKFEVELTQSGTQNGTIEFAFNDGTNKWDSNNNLNYKVGPGIYTFIGGTTSTQQYAGMPKP
jgi:chitodextrinase